MILIILFNLSGSQFICEYKSQNVTHTSEQYYVIETDYGNVLHYTDQMLATSYVWPLYIRNEVRTNKFF